MIISLQERFPQILKYLEELNSKVEKCTICPRLVAFRKSVATSKRKMFAHEEYWEKPVPGFGDSQAGLLVVGLAPAAHGGNRTGRVFTGDKSAEFLFGCLYAAGLSNQHTSTRRGDGLQLINSYMTPVLKCVPPQDKPTAGELSNCFSYFERELAELRSLKVILALGKVAFDSCLKYFHKHTPIIKKNYQFGHGSWYEMPGGHTLVSSFHPSPRNVNTKRLSHEMMVNLLVSIKGVL